MSSLVPSGPSHPTFLQALKTWLKIGLLSFGGPAGQIALMHTELVEKLKWVSDRRFLHAMNYCMLLPGPEAQQTAIYIGWLLHRKWGGVAAGVLFVLPGALLMLVISYVYVTFGHVPVIGSVFYGLKIAVMAIVASAVVRIGNRVLKNPVMWLLSALSFVSIFFLGVPFPVIILSALLIGLIFGRIFPAIFDITKGHKSYGGGENPGGYVISDDGPNGISRPTCSGTICTAVIWSVIWLAPLLVCLRLLGWDHILTQQGIFFSKVAMVTFGGAYAVLPYVAQYAVEVREWLTAAQMMDGLGLAETTPGPLILVLQFVGFMGGWNHPADMSPLMTATLAAGVTSWMTFMPGCLFIFVGAPFIEQTHGNLNLTTALSAVTAAVVGVVLNLAVWFAWNIIKPDATTFNWLPLVAGAVFLFIIQRWRWDVLKVVGAGAVLGLVLHVAGIQ